MGYVRDSPGASVPSSRIEPPFRPRVSISLDPSFAVNFPVETSRHNADSESNDHPGLRRHMPLMRGLLPIAIKQALPYPSAFAFSTLYKNTPRSGITAFRLPDCSSLHPGAKCER